MERFWLLETNQQISGMQTHTCPLLHPPLPSLTLIVSINVSHLQQCHRKWMNNQGHWAEKDAVRRYPPTHGCDPETRTMNGHRLQRFSLKLSDKKDGTNKIIIMLRYILCSFVAPRTTPFWPHAPLLPSFQLFSPLPASSTPFQIAGCR